jgi:hypothetical protein
MIHELAVGTLLRQMSPQQMSPDKQAAKSDRKGDQQITPRHLLSGHQAGRGDDAKHPEGGS